MSSTESPAVPGVKRYRKRPIEIDTIQWTGSNLDAIRLFTGDASVACPAAGDLTVWNDQEHAWIPCPVGHSVAKGLLGELYPVSPAAVAATYEAVIDTEPDVAERAALGAALTAPGDPLLLSPEEWALVLQVADLARRRGIRTEPGPVTRAVTAERERCAQVAEDLGAHYHERLERTRGRSVPFAGYLRGQHAASQRNTPAHAALLGQRVRVKLDEHIVHEGKLLGFDEGAEIQLEGDDGFVWYGWPALEITPAPAREETQ
jgi:hypothetical protein